MSLGTTLRMGFALLGLTMAGACAQRELDRKPELAQEHGYYVPFDEARERGGVGGYVDVPSNSERTSLNETSHEAGVAVAPVDEAVKPQADAQPQKSATVAILEESPQTILFDTGDSTLKDESMSVLDQIAMQLKRAGDVMVKIDGFADKTGTSELNKQLSEDRANSVYDYLEAQGVPTDKLDVASFGEEQATGAGANPNDRKVVLSLG